MKKVVRKYADYIGVSGSTLCLIHCLSGFFIPFIGVEYLHTHDMFGKYHDIILALFSLIAVYYASQLACSNMVKFFLWGFVLMLVITIFLHSFSSKFEWTLYLSYIASFGLISTHLLNIYVYRTSKAKEPT